MSLSASGSETNRATVVASAPTGGLSEDIEQLQASEDRRIVGWAYNDTAGGGNVTAEVSFSSSANTDIGDKDNTKASTLFYAGGQLMETGVDIEWSAGEEIHVHVRNNSGSGERCFLTLYYDEV